MSACVNNKYFYFLKLLSKELFTFFFFLLLDLLYNLISLFSLFIKLYYFSFLLLQFIFCLIQMHVQPLEHPSTSLSHLFVYFSHCL